MGRVRSLTPTVKSRGTPFRLHSPCCPRCNTRRLANHLYAVLETAGNDPALPSSLPSQRVTFPLEAHGDISHHRDHPCLQEAVPDDPWRTETPSIHEHGSLVGKKDIDKAFQSRNWERSAIELRDVAAEREIPAKQQQRSSWLDQQQSWLDWAEISFARSSASSSDGSEDELNINVALQTADQPMPDLDSTAYLVHARWGSDPAFTADNFMPPVTQLSETEVTGIWKEYVAASLKPVFNVLGANPPENQLLIVGNHDRDHEQDEVRKHIRSFQSSNVDSSQAESLSFPFTATERKPLRPFRGGRKKPMPPRVRPWLEQYSMHM
jgi:hypothetical protein